MKRDEHLDWCKQRALAYVDAGDVAGALASMLSDMRKHPETADHIALNLMGRMMFGGLLSEPSAVRRFIEGFN